MKKKLCTSLIIIVLLGFVACALFCCLWEGGDTTIYHHAEAFETNTTTADTALSGQLTEDLYHFEQDPIYTAAKVELDSIVVDFLTREDIQSYYFESDGITILEEAVNSQHINTKISLSQENGYINAYIDTGDGVYQKKTYYFHHDNTTDKVFISSDSLAEAKFDAVQYKFDSGAMSEAV